MKLSPCKHCGSPAHLTKAITDPHLCWSVACSNLDCGISTRAFSQQDMAVDAWQRTAPAPAYCHRNGENEPPTETELIGTGQYLFKGAVTSPDCGTFTIDGIVDCYLDSVYNYSTGETLPKHDHVGRWWGPIFVPHEDGE